RRRAVGAGERSGAARRIGRGSARAGRGEPRRQDEDARHHRGPRPPSRWTRPRRRTAVPSSALIRAISSAYGAAAAWRRHYYSSQPSRRRRLARPVVSVGNLRVGGSGKTPLVEYIARLLLASGHRPAVLTRGYARRVVRDGVTVVSDGAAVLA